MTRPVTRAAIALLAAVAVVPLGASPALAKGHPTGGGGGSTLGPGTGVDVSFPQCGGTLPGGQAFAVIGVNGGVANDYNSCLRSEWSYAAASTGTTKQSKAQAYLNTGDPGNAVADWPSPANYGSYPSGSSATPYGACGYASGSSGAGAMTPGCAYIYGYDMVAGGISDGPSGIIAGDRSAFQSATGAVLTSQPVWLNVETGNSWLTGASGQSMNVADLAGMVDALRASNPSAAVGVYSTGYQWNQITGTPTGTAAGNLAGLPDWIPGASSQSGATSMCSTAAFTAGPVTMTQWTSGSIDDDHSCIG